MALSNLFRVNNKIADLQVHNHIKYNALTVEKVLKIVKKHMGGENIKCYRRNLVTYVFFYDDSLIIKDTENSNFFVNYLNYWI